MMNYDQSLDRADDQNASRLYAMLGDFYVAEVSEGSGSFTLSKSHADADVDLSNSEIIWLDHNVPGIRFFKIQLQAQSVEHYPERQPKQG